MLKKNKPVIVHGVVIVEAASRRFVSMARPRTTHNNAARRRVYWPVNGTTNLMSRRLYFSVCVFCCVVGFHFLAVAAYAGKPIPCGKGVPTEAQWNDEVLAHRQKELEFYQKFTKDPPGVQKSVLAFLDGYLRKSFDKSDAPSWESLEKQGDALSAGGAKDPFFVSTLGMVKTELGKVKEGRDMAKAAFDDISATKYPAAIKLKACARWRPLGPQRPDANDPWRVNIRETVRLAVEYAEETADQPKEQKFVWREISPYVDSSESYDAFEVQKRLFEAVEKTGKIHPWTKHMVEGFYYDALGWHLRGGGFADAVTQEGWRGFRENIEKAAEHLTKAWELDRTVPDAAAHMIYVTNSGAESELSPRDWFDAAVQARMDFEPAYRHIVHHLLPQWNGSHEQMYQFGLECLKTKRFDTEVPFQLITILVTIDEQSGGSGAIWCVPGVYENAKLVLESLEKELPHTQKFAAKHITPEWILTFHGAIAAKAGHYDDARKALDKVGTKLRKDAFIFAESHFPLDGSRVYALTGSGREDVQNFEDVVGEGHLSDPAVAKSARELLDKAAAATREPQARSYFKHWKNHLLWREQFEKGEWVDLTFDENFSMWQIKMGTWTYENPHSAVCDAHLLDIGYNSLSCEVPFDGPLEIELDVANLDRACYYMSGVMLGNIWDSTSPQTGCYFYICPRANAHGILVPRAQINDYVGITYAAEHLRIQAWDDAYLYYVSEMEFPIRSAKGMTLGNKIELVGSKQHGAVGRTRFSNIRVRKLKAPPPPMEKDGNRLGYFDGLIAKNPQDGFLYYQRGLCRKSLKQWPEAEADLKKALSLSSDIPVALLALSEVEDSLGHFASMVEELDRYLKIKPDDVKANSAIGWLLATCRDDKIRNGKLAIQHARKACELADYGRTGFFDALAAACAENGDFDEAVKWVAKAVELAPDRMKPELRRRLDIYKSKKPYHEP